MPQRIVDLPIGQRIEWLLDHNRRQSTRYFSPDAQQEREAYRSNSRLISFACMDGRINVPLITKTPSGCMKVYGNIGGIFDLGWDTLGLMFEKEVKQFERFRLERKAAGKRCLVMITYHFSKGDNEHRGCAGCNYDLGYSIEVAKNLYFQIERIYGSEYRKVRPVLIGIETDTDGMIIHGENFEESIDLFKRKDLTPNDLRKELRAIFDIKKMPAEVFDDLFRLARNNILHIHETIQQNRPLIDIVHAEWMLGFGTGIRDWLALPNIALVIGPYDPYIAKPIATAAGIIRKNMKEGRVPDDGFLLLATANYHNTDPGSEAGARETVRARMATAKKAIEERFQDEKYFLGKIYPLMGIVSWEKRDMQIIR